VGAAEDEEDGGRRAQRHTGRRRECVNLTSIYWMLHPFDPAFFAVSASNLARSS